MPSSLRAGRKLTNVRLLDLRPVAAGLTLEGREAVGLLFISGVPAQRVQTSVTRGTTRTMVYDLFGQDIADYTGSSGSTLERENLYRGGQLLVTYETAGSGSYKYVLQDIQGSTRVVMSSGTSPAI